MKCTPLHIDPPIPKDFRRTVEYVAQQIRLYNSIADIIVILPPPDAGKEPIPPSALFNTDLVQVVTIDWPFEERELPEEAAIALKTWKNCCGFKEYFKINAFRMLQYERVILLDSDILVGRNFDILFGCPESYDLLFTSGVMAPLNGGMLVMRPKMETYEAMRETILDPNSFSRTTGWFGKGFPFRRLTDEGAEHDLSIPPDCPANSVPLAYGYEGPQGFLWSFFHFGDKAARFRAAPIDPCLFNFMWGHSCTAKSFGKTYMWHK